MQRGVGHVPTIPSLRNTYLAIHTWATTQTFSSLHRCTAKVLQHSLHNGLSGQVQRRFKHGKNKKPDDAKTQEKKPPWPKGFKPSQFEKRLPWADTNWDIVKGNVDWKYMKTKRYADSQASRPEWDYEVQLEENPEHARYLKLWINAAWFLRILAKDQGFYVAPDGFVRISDALRFPPFAQFSGEEFARRLLLDPDDRFEVARLPDMVNGKLQDVYWVRARARHKMLGVVPVNRRIIQVETINTAIYITSPENWDYIKRHGIPPREDRMINLERDLETHVFRGRLPEEQKLLCVTIDCVAAAKLGVMFYRTDQLRLFATVPDYISENGNIPRLAFRSAVLLDVSMQRSSRKWGRDGASANEDSDTATNRNVQVAENGTGDVATGQNVTGTRKRNNVGKRLATPPTRRPVAKMVDKAAAKKDSNIATKRNVKGAVKGRGKVVTGRSVTNPKKMDNPNKRLSTRPASRSAAPAKRKRTWEP